jgi:hypothetical protein
LAFSGSELGGEPLSTLKAFMQKVPKNEYNSDIYDKFAKTYSDAGQANVARSILIEKNNAAFRHSESSWDKISLFTMWAIFAYGHKPEIGLVWILLFVISAAIIFRTGARQVSGAPVPRNWFFFAVDSVIPGIKLDKDHENLKFRGWRQYCLYVLRFLGAVLIVLIIEVLRRSVTGSK